MAPGRGDEMQTLAPSRGMSKGDLRASVTQLKVGLEALLPAAGTWAPSFSPADQGLSSSMWVGRGREHLPSRPAAPRHGP